MKIVILIALAFLLVGCGEESAQTKTASEELKQEVAAAKTEEKSPIVESAAVTQQEVKQEVKVQKDGATLYKTCVSCHGADGSKSALSKSGIIKGWDAKKIEESLFGYQNGTYGGASKALMVGQVKNLSEADIKILSEYIAKF